MELVGTEEDGGLLLGRWTGPEVLGDSREGLVGGGELGRDVGGGRKIQFAQNPQGV